MLSAKNTTLRNTMAPPLTTCERLRVDWFISSRKHARGVSAGGLGFRGQIRPTVDIVAALGGHGEFFRFRFVLFSIYLRFPP